MNDEEVPSVNTDEQRRALDVMSAKLLDKLNSMIAEQEARVQEFSLQQSSLSPLPMPEMTPVVAPVPPQQVVQPQAPVRTLPQTPVSEQAKPIGAETYAKMERHAPVETTAPTPPPLHRSVTPPPLSSQKKKAAEQTYRIPRPTLNRPAPAAKGDSKENSVGCGKLAVLVVIVIILLRACS